VRAQGLEELVPADLRLHPRVVGLLGGGVLLRDDLRRAQASPELSAQLRELLIAHADADALRLLEIGEKLARIGADEVSEEAIGRRGVAEHRDTVDGLEPARGGLHLRARDLL